MGFLRSCCTEGGFPEDMPQELSLGDICDIVRWRRPEVGESRLGSENGPCKGTEVCEDISV